MSKRDDLLAFHRFLREAARRGARYAQADAMINGEWVAVCNGMALLDSAIVKVSRELRGGR